MATTPKPRLLTVTAEEVRHATKRRPGPPPSDILTRVRALQPGQALVVQPCPHRLKGKRAETQNGGQGCTIRQIPYREWVLTGIHYTVRHSAQNWLFITRDG